MSFSAGGWSLLIARLLPFLGETLPSNSYIDEVYAQIMSRILLIQLARHIVVCPFVPVYLIGGNGKCSQLGLVKLAGVLDFSVICYSRCSISIFILMIAILLMIMSTVFVLICVIGFIPTRLERK